MLVEQLLLDNNTKKICNIYFIKKNYPIEMQCNYKKNIPRLRVSFVTNLT